MKDSKYLHEAYNATSTDDGKGGIESYKKWLERQLLFRINKEDKLTKKTAVEFLIEKISETLGSDILETIPAEKAILLAYHFNQAKRIEQNEINLY
jgi:allophanate hydrolase subunit 1